MTARVHAVSRPSNAASPRRLLDGIGDAAVEPTLDEHLAHWGPLAHRSTGALLDELDASGVTGRGGAWFPVGTKWRSVVESGRRRPVVIANGAEGEPASRKDAMLLERAPHLVLDGLSVAAHALRAQRAVVYVNARSRPHIERAVRARAQRGLDDLVPEVVTAEDAFLAGQETAVVNAVNRRPGLPSFAGLQSIRERGVDGAPTLVHNVETMAHVALIARFGARWFRGVGTAELPGTMLFTLTDQGSPVVLEAALGSTLIDAVGLDRQRLSDVRGVLLGGYGGGWVTPEVFSTLPVSEKAVRRVGSSLGPGIVVPLPAGSCPLAEMADVVQYMEGQGAHQCGPCVYGLASLTDDLRAIAYGGRGRRPQVERLLQTCNLVEGRGACRHPDGVARFVRTGLSVFTEEVERHHAHGACRAAQSDLRWLTLPERAGGDRRRLLALA